MQQERRTRRIGTTTKLREYLDKIKLTPRQKVRREALNVLSQRPESQVYAGTANANAVARRRAKNRVARRSRQINRRKG